LGLYQQGAIGQDATPLVYNSVECRLPWDVVKLLHSVGST
jgi:hypothetical protein